METIKEMIENNDEDQLLENGIVPNELTYTDNDFRYKLNEGESEISRRNWDTYIYDICDNSREAPRNLDEMREFEDTTIEVSFTMILERDALTDYVWYKRE